VSLVRDSIMLMLTVYTFTVWISIAATGAPETLHNAPLAIVDEARSSLWRKIEEAFYSPQFNRNLQASWPGSLIENINTLTLFSIMLTARPCLASVSTGRLSICW